MTKFLQSKMTFAAAAVLFAVASFANAAAGSKSSAPITQLGPTMPPSPWDEGKQNAQLGPTMPPSPWDEGK